jgi:chaperone modulatory protein CbpM
MTRQGTFSLDELVAAEGLDRTELTAWVERRWILPLREGERWQFTEVDAARARLLAALHRDMEFDDDTVGLLLSLIDEIHALRAGLGAIADAIQAQPEAVRKALIARAVAARTEPPAPGAGP